MFTRVRHVVKSVVRWLYVTSDNLIIMFWNDYITLSIPC